MRRALAVAVLAVAFTGLTATAARAHATLMSAEPAPGSATGTAPSQVSILFSEEPERSLSSIDILDSSGISVASGVLEQDPAEPLILRRGFRGAAEGVYTVSWQTFSRVDGHVLAGAYAFGVGVDPSEVASAEPPEASAPAPSPLEVGARWMFFVGLGIVLGVSWIGASAFRLVPGGLWRLVLIGWLTSAGGLILLTEAQRRASGATLGTLLGISIGRALLARAIAIAVAGALIVLARFQTGAQRSVALALSGVAAAAAMWIHVAAGHAGAGDGWPITVTAQWVHFVAVGVWLGGLAALLAGVRGEPGEEKARAVKRFSTVAGVALFVVLVTGILRSISELNTVGDLWTSGYGRVVGIKVILLAALAALGAVNRYRNVPASISSLTGLRRISRAELGVGATVFAAAGLLASLTPPTAVSAVDAIAADPIVVTGTDLGQRVRVELTVSPGVPGPNSFTVRATRARGNEPFEADSARMIFRYREDPAVGPTELPLDRAGPGAWSASSATFSLPGRWGVAVLLQSSSDSVEVPLEIATKCRAVANEIPGGPTLYDVALGESSAQGYTDPAAPGFNEVHMTFFDAAGTELTVDELPSMFATPPDGDRVEMVVRRFSDGHFLGDAQLTPGVWRFDVTAVMPGGDTVRLCFNDEIQG